MQFSYEVSEAEYLAAWKIHSREHARPKTVKVVMFWAFVLVCLLVLWVVVQKNAHHSPTRVGNGDATAVTDSDEDTPPPPRANVAQSLITNLGPFVLIGGVWVFMILRLLPGGRLRKLYRSDPLMKGTYTVEITPDFIAVQNTAGFSSRSEWNLYEYWKESKDLIVLGLRSQAYFIVALSQHSSEQREEIRILLRSVLAAR